MFWFKFFSLVLFVFVSSFVSSSFISKKKGGGCNWVSDIIFDFLFSLKFIPFFVLKKGGISLCLWGFLCPVCLELQGRSYLPGLLYSSSVTESQFERYPPWSCRSFDSSDDFITIFIYSCCCCFFGFAVGCDRHEKYSQRVNFEYYCSSQPCCCCGEELSIEDCLIGYFCCCCSIIQVTMANDARFRMQSKVEGDVNIKHALWKERKNYWQNKKGQF